MRFLTKEESIRWCNDHKIILLNNNHPDLDKLSVNTVTFPVPGSLRLVPLARLFADYLLRGDECLLWVTDWSIWPTSENLSLYYKLRNAYANSELLIDKPGHLFSKHEGDDFVNFLHLGLLFGWNCYLISATGQTKVFASNDEMIDFHSLDNESLQTIKSRFVPNVPAG